MDGIHDVGGRQGFGPIRVTDEDAPFPTDWEARAFGIAKSVTGAPDYNLDKFRYTREQLPPLEFLTSPYFEQWMRCTMAMLVGSGLVTPQELATGRSDGPERAKLGSPKTAQDARKAIGTAIRFDGPCDAEPKFREGDRISVTMNAPRGHTRLPQYVRGRTGRIVAHCGAHGVPDDNVRNVRTFEPLYTVAFALRDLFAEHPDSIDMVHVEIWERFLVRTE